MCQKATFEHSQFKYSDHVVAKRVGELTHPDAVRFGVHTGLKGSQRNSQSRPSVATFRNKLRRHNVARPAILRGFRKKDQALLWDWHNPTAQRQHRRPSLSRSFDHCIGSSLVRCRSLVMATVSLWL